VRIWYLDGNASKSSGRGEERLAIGDGLVE
jgi:hypothetical protein